MSFLFDIYALFTGLKIMAIIGYIAVIAFIFFAIVGFITTIKFLFFRRKKPRKGEKSHLESSQAERDWLRTGKF